jgi:WD40 repeat protein
VSFVDIVERLREISNPYPGLRPFETAESHLFYGRDRQVAELVARLERNRFLTVVGVSGSGKSSLVKAGLLPALARGHVLEAGQRWRTVSTRPGAAPFANLAADLRRAGLDPAGLADSSHGLITIAQQLATDESLLVVVDQFEELFRYKDVLLPTDESRRRRGVSAGEAAEFVQLLIAASRHTRPVFVVLTMRSDYLGECAEFRDLPETLNDSQYLVPRMTREQRKEAIEVPLASVGIASSLMQRMLNDAGDEPDQLPVLQHALMRTWNHWRRADPELKRPIELQDYVAIGGFHHAIDQHAEEIYATVDQGIAETIFKRLTAKGGSNRERRDPATVDELCALCAATRPEDRARVIAVIDRFRCGEATFLTPRDGEIAGSIYIDITHESLIRQWRRLRDTWLVEEQQSAKTFLSLVERAKSWEAQKAEPLSGLDLSDVRQWVRRRNPTAAWAEHYGNPSDVPVISRFVDASVAHDRNQRLRKRGLFVAMTLVVALALFSYAAIRLLRQAESARRISEARQLAAQSQLRLNEQVNLEPSVLLAIEALRRYPSFDTERALRQAVARLPRQLTSIPPGTQSEPITDIAVSPDGSVLVVAAHRDVRVFDGKTFRTLSAMEADGAVFGMAVGSGSDKSWILATRNPANDAIHLVTVPDGRETRRLPEADVAGVVMSLDGRYVAILDGMLHLYDMQSSRVVTLPRVQAQALAIGPDGRRIAVVSNVATPIVKEDYRAIVFDSAARKEVFNLKLPGLAQTLAFSADGRWLAIGGDDGLVRVIDVKSWAEATRLNAASPVIAVAFSPDARLVATGTEDGTTRVFDSANGLELSRRTVHCAASTSKCVVRAVAFSSDGRTVLSGGDAGSLAVFEAAGANEVARLTEFPPVTALAFGMDGRRLVVGSGQIEAASIRILDAPTWIERARFSPPSPEVRSVAMSENGRFVAVGSNWFGGPWIYDLDDVQKAPKGLGGPSLMTSLAMSRDGSSVAALASDDVQLYERASGQRIELSNSRYAQSMALTANGMLLAIGGADRAGGVVRVSELPAGKESWRVEQPSPVKSLTPSADGRWIAAGLLDGPYLQIIDTFAQRNTWRQLSAAEQAVSFSLDGAIVALVLADGTLRTFQTATGEEVERMVPGRKISALHFADNATTLLAASIAPSIYSTSDVVIMRYPLRHDDLIADACNRVTRNLSADEWRALGAEPPQEKTCPNVP